MPNNAVGAKAQAYAACPKTIQAVCDGVEMPGVRVDPALLIEHCQDHVDPEVTADFWEAVNDGRPCVTTLGGMFPGMFPTA